MQRLIANLLLGWLVLLLPGATALDLARPELLLPACCRAHGAHHCAMSAMPGQGSRGAGAPAWSGPGCPFAHLLHAAMVLPQYAAAQPWRLNPGPEMLSAVSADVARAATSSATLPGQRGPPPSI